MRNVERLARIWIKRGVVAGGIVGLGWALGFSADPGPKSVDVYGQPLDSWPTRSPATATAIPTVTPIPTITPIPSATPDIQATVRAAITASAPTPDIQATVRAAITANALPPTPVIILPPQSQQPAPRQDVIIVKPEPVKPEVVKPEIVKVPEIVRVEVPVTPIPDANTLIMPKQTFNEFMDRAVARALADEREKIMTEERQKAQTEVNAAKAAQQKAEAEARDATISRGWRFDWWSAIIGGAVSLGIGAIVFTRPPVVRYLNEHGHIHLP